MRAAGPSQGRPQPPWWGAAHRAAGGDHASVRVRGRQQGIVVFVALIAMVLLSLAAVGLMRSVHTSTMVVGNLAFRQAAIALSTAAVEKAVHDMFPPTQTIANLRNDDLPRNYYAVRQAGEDSIGVPAVLQGNMSAYPGAFQKLSDNAGNTASYVVERMCLPAANGLDPTPDVCEMIPPKQSPGTTGNINVGIPLPKLPFYRMTVRVDGPGNSVSYSQAMLRP